MRRVFDPAGISGDFIKGWMSDRCVRGVCVCDDCRACVLLVLCACMGVRDESCTLVCNSSPKTKF